MIKYFTNSELKKLFKTIENSEGKNQVRDEAIFKIGYYCALRASEISIINIEDYNSPRNELYCKRLKGSNNNTIKIIDKDILRALKRHIRNNNPESVMFISQKKNPISRKTLDYLMKKYCSIAQIKDISKWHFHTLKHTRAVDLGNSGLDLKDIQYWLGHKEVSNTEIYFQFTSQQQENMYNKIVKNISKLS
ncbi:tyrosine-type recombinase/integrase [Clostridium tyrobutyricum]|uniref:tyrosine-type recombinase/integrase n=1 Tax=Clostridium tyrobutyricum TaxID=1519 RepID=UPI001C385D79|nr:tyrosine-type recombinase/integrase [Clostridium tyrobutyricum]MBV4416982.1 site-specific integrase [Clostridium tyrobutyricum]